VLGRIHARSELPIAICPPKTVELDQSKDRPDAEIQKGEKCDNEARVARPALALVKAIRCRPRTKGNQQGESKHDPREKRLRRPPRDDEENAIENGGKRGKLEKANETPNGVSPALLCNVLKHVSLNAA